MSVSGLRVCVVVNKDDGVIGPSETFLHAHATRLPAEETIALVGNPGYRRWGLDGGPHVQAQYLLARGVRWLARRAGLQTAVRGPS